MKGEEDGISSADSGSTTCPHDPNFSIGNMESKLHLAFAQSLCNPSPINFPIASSNDGNDQGGTKKIDSSSSSTENTSLSFGSNTTISSDDSKPSSSFLTEQNHNVKGDDDHAEGIKAFMEKRNPVFSGN